MARSGTVLGWFGSTASIVWRPILVVLLAAAMSLVLAQRLAVPDHGADELSGPVTLTRTGGNGGGDLRLVVFPDGVWVSSGLGERSARGRLSTIDVQSLARAVDRAHLGHDRTGHDPDDCCDLAYVTVTYDGHTGYFVGGDGSNRVWHELEPLLYAPYHAQSSP